MNDLKRKLYRAASLLLLLLLVAAIPMQTFAAGPSRPSREDDASDENEENDGESSGPSREKEEDEGTDLGLFLVIGAAAAVVAGGVILIVVLSTTSKKKTSQNMIQEENMGTAVFADNYEFQDAGPAAPVNTAPQMDGWENVSIEEQGMKLYAVGVSGALKGKEYPIVGQDTIIGRAEEAVVRYPADSQGVSRRHCKILWQNGGLMIMDMGSTSGTYLKDKGKLPVNVPVALVDGDIIYLGSQDNALSIRVKL